MGTPDAHSSKDKFQSHLPDAGRTCTGDDPKGSTKEVACGVHKLGMVKGVEELTAELERLGLRQPNVLVKGEVPVIEARPVEELPAGVAERSDWS